MCDSDSYQPSCYKTAVEMRDRAKEKAMAGKLPTLREIRKWAKEKEWEVARSWGGDYQLRKRIQVTPRAYTFTMYTSYEVGKRFRQLCGYLMNTDEYEWRE